MHPHPHPLPVTRPHTPPTPLLSLSQFHTPIYSNQSPPSHPDRVCDANDGNQGTPAHPLTHLFKTLSITIPFSHPYLPPFPFFTHPSLFLPTTFPLILTECAMQTMEIKPPPGALLDLEPRTKSVAVYRPKVMGSVFGGSSAAEALEMELDVHNGTFSSLVHPVSPFSHPQTYPFTHHLINTHFPFVYPPFNPPSLPSNTPSNPPSYPPSHLSGRPAPTDYCQLPDWLLKFAPNVSGTFAHDEVLLAMRQDDATRDALSAIEDDSILEYIEMLYEASPIRFTHINISQLDPTNYLSNLLNNLTSLTTLPS